MDRTKTTKKSKIMGKKIAHHSEGGGGFSDMSPVKHSALPVENNWISWLIHFAACQHIFNSHDFHI